ncbi:hypothetical protein JNW98_33895, partial [Streptomyces sp. SCA2-4]|nr:hypothetical protein [Streptomyces huiliensis]
MGKHSARTPQAPQASRGRTEEAPEIPGAREAVRTAERSVRTEDDGPSGRPEPVVRSAPRGPSIGWGVIGRQAARPGPSGRGRASGARPPAAA